MKEIEKKIRDNFNKAFENALIDENSKKDDDEKIEEVEEKASKKK